MASILSKGWLQELLLEILRSSTSSLGRVKWQYCVLKANNNETALSVLTEVH